ncbi:MAG: NF038122 family metalloprotease [Cyanobacteria bacterium J06634_6]
MVKSFCCFNATLPVALVLSVPLVAVSQSSAWALSFRFNFDGNASDEFQSAVRDAGETWSSLLKDDVVVDLYIRYTDLSAIGGDILGGAQPGKTKVDYAEYVNAAFKDVVSSDDYFGVNSLQLNAGGQQQVQQAKWENTNLYSNAGLSEQNFSFLSDKRFSNPNSGADGPSQGNGSPPSGIYWREGYSYDGHYYPAYYIRLEEGGYKSYYENVDEEYEIIDDYYRNYQRSYEGSGHSQPSSQTSEGYVDDNSSNNNRNVSLTKAQAKALGLLSPQESGLDGVISINSSVNWDLDQDDGIDRDKYDVATVLQHEIGHVLGLVSGVDALDYLYSSGGADDANLDDSSGFSYLTPMDFYRYTSESADLDVADLTLGGDGKYFSLDGGKSIVRDQYGRAAYFSTGSAAVDGDGYQGSHWKEGNNYPLGVLNPTLKKGRANSISALDLTLLDVVGWDLENSTEKKASALGIDWRGVQGDMATQKQQVIDETVSRWADEIPALRAAIQDASVAVDIRFNEQVQEALYALSDILKQGGKDDADYQRAVSQFYVDVYEYASQRDRQIESVPYEIYNVDLTVRQWLELPTEQLSARMRTAEIIEINRLSNVVKAEPYERRQVLEAKLREAVAPFADEPIQLVQDLLDESGPSNPIGFGSTKKWWFFYQREGDEYYYDDAPIAYYSEMAFQRTGESVENGVSAAVAPSEVPAVGGIQPISGSALSLSAFDTKLENSIGSNNPKDIPEPSTVLGLFGIAVLGAAGCKRKRG